MSIVKCEMKKVNERYETNNKEIVISIKDITKSFDDLKVLNGVNIDIYRSENLVILGRSGTGKSVLLRIIAGLLAPDSGTVTVFDRNVHKLSSDELQQLRLKMGFSFQGSALYDGMTVRENLEFPVRRNKRDMEENKINEAVEKVLEEVGLPDTINQMPSELSGGQQKRISIARTLILEPEIMLYDEPTGGLDPVTSIEINNLIQKVQERYKTTSVIITHDLTCAKATGNRVAMLLDGKFVKTGTFEEVFESDNKIIQSFYNYNFIKQPANEE
jgi:phospholipid/cholesterol/gamma-HCH transport system ATP-binding protein